MDNMYLHNDHFRYKLFSKRVHSSNRVAYNGTFRTTNSIKSKFIFFALYKIEFF
jgi:hypothetical protein